MKTETFRSAVRFIWLIATVSLAIPSLPAQAQSGAQVLAASAKSSVATANFFRSDGCIRTGTQVTLLDWQGTDNQSGHVVEKEAYVYVGSFDVCTPQNYFFGNGGIELSPDQFAFDEKVGSARLTATIPVFDQVSLTVVDVNVDLTWIATDGPVGGPVVTHFTYPDGSKFTSFGNGNRWDAIASGTVSAGGVNFTPNPSEGAQIVSGSGGFIVINKSGL
jgi:hypothetical protein